ncbi:MAG TPA: hypothetical protein ACFYEK_08995 [Candidatus Wunengus sp. YC60]|uniref:hypothetical protein n=1 Tax=Candidatus Wunengus sp. YC60 TaxID=3367697 RepID=UPI00402731BE
MSETAVLEKELGETKQPPCLKCEENECDSLSDVARQIVCKLQAFDEAITKSTNLEIDGLAIENKPCDTVTQESRIKVINKALESAFEVEIDTIIKTPLDDLILALQTGVFTRLSGITRIVGYYSRISNWNKSKIGELQDRHCGQYAVK